MNKAKALKTAKEWLFPALLYAIHDCCDSMHDAEKLEERFNAYVDDSIPIEKFVKENLYKEYLEEVINALKEGGNMEEWVDELSNTPSDLPIPFSEFKDDLEKLLISKE